MTDKQMKKFAGLRLEVTGRKCDGCGGTIGRYTSKCHYNVKVDRVYCSTGGCAERIRECGVCASCDAQLDPFVVVPVFVPGVGEMCGGCAAAGVTPQALAGLKVLDPEGADLSKKDRQAVLDGPYVVVEYKPGWYQVGYPLGGGELSVRSTGRNVERLFEKCAEFNRM